MTRLADKAKEVILQKHSYAIYVIKITHVICAYVPFITHVYTCIKCAHVPFIKNIKTYPLYKMHGIRYQVSDIIQEISFIF